MLAILQARCSSRRLPNKVLRPLLGCPMVLREIERLSRSRHIDRIVLATSVDPSDDGLYDVAREAGIDVYRGSLDDVLDRYYACAKEYGADHIVRVTGDCPLIDWRVSDDVIVRHLTEKNDYTHTTERFPDGLDTEIMTFAALEQAHREARLVSEREHVTLYFRNHPERFRIGDADCTEDYGDMRWTVDEPCDFAFVEAVYEKLYAKNNDFSMQDILALLKEHPDLWMLNQGIVRNEGLLKSLAEDMK
ncbi:glycosyltransferase family protein [uncultured Selenomonas sp.]|uniref:glycosyltransferase family protein n=1 Tax=uncultured Selenomonas sp. TaxID=159275 RepID=UPI0028D85656|nr:glycosyltransferase family protein [uncultured Selenomonas sp.]